MPAEGSFHHPCAVRSAEEMGAEMNMAIAPAVVSASRMVAVLELIDSVLATRPNEEVEANLYSARLHVVRAINEQAKEVA